MSMAVAGRREAGPGTGRAASPPGADRVAVLFANLKGNIGDFAILHAVLRAVAGEGREIDVFPHGHLPVDRARLDGFRASGVPAFTLQRRTYFAPVPPKLKRLHRLGLWPWVQPVLIRRLLGRSAGDARRFAGYGAVYLVGGDHWNGMDLAIGMFATLMAVAQQNDRIRAFPFSVNPAIRQFNTARDLARYFDRLGEPRIVRDTISAEVMQGLGVATVLRSDSVFALRDLGLAVAAARGRDEGRVLLSLTGDRAGALEPSLERVVRQLQGSGLRLALLTTCEPEDGEIYGRIGRRLGIPVIAPLTWQETVAELKASRLFITNRLHGLILGTFAGTPMLPVGDRKKSAAFVRDAAMPHHAPGLADLTAELVRRAIEDAPAIVDRMVRYRDASAAQQDEVQQSLAVR